MIKLKNKNAGITLVALIVTIIILLILAGITIAQLTGNGIFEKSKLAKMRSEYASAKEKVEMKLMEVQTDCVENEKEYTIKEIAKNIREDKEITIEKYYNSNTASIKSGITENLENLIGIVVSVDQYSEYKFLIGKNCKIEGITIEEIIDTTDIGTFKPKEEFEKEVLGKGDSTGNTSDNIKEGIVDYWPLTNSLKNQISNGAGDLIEYTGENTTIFTLDGAYLNNIVLSTKEDYILSNAYSIVFQIKATKINTWSHVIGKHIKVIKDNRATGLFMWKSETEPIIISGNKTYMKPGKALYTVDKQSTIVITHTGSLMSVYSDGEFIESIDTENTDIDSKFYIGGSSKIGENVSGYKENYSPGYYKNVIIYNRAITEDEIKKLQEELK